MANTTTFAFTNTIPIADVTPSVIDIGAKTNYALVGEQPTVVEMQNKTAPLDQGERLTYRCQDIDKVSTAQAIQNPSKVRNGVQYVIKLEEILRTRDADGNILYDEPIVAYLTVRHQKTGTITDSHIETVLYRLLGACFDKTAHEWRFADLMRSALQPVED